MQKLVIGKIFLICVDCLNYNLIKRYVRYGAIIRMLQFSNTTMIQRFLEIFRQIFQETGHIAHYNMMMGIDS